MPALQDQRVIHVGTSTGLTIRENVYHTSILYFVRNESELEYILTACFDGSKNVTVVPKRTDVTAINPTTYSVTVAPQDEKKFVIASCTETREPYEIKYTTSLQWRVAPRDVTYVSRLVSEIEDLANGVTNPETIAFKCHQAGLPFVDISFPPTAKSIVNDHLVEWMRPQEFLAHQQAKIFGGQGTSTTDLRMGNRDQHRFLSFLGVAAGREDLLERVILTEETDLNLGVIRLMICRDGWWDKVLIDSFIPCDPSVGQPYYMRCKGGELWGSIMEKAWAKVHGGYHALDCGDLAWFLTSCTGYPCTTLRPQNDKFKINAAWASLKAWHQNGDIIGASVPDDDIANADGVITAAQIREENARVKEPLGVAGFHPNHTYHVLDIREYVPKDIAYPTKLVKLQNLPWSNKEWRGRYSGSWDGWTEEAREELDADRCWVDNTFWIPFDDMVKYFTSITACHYRPEWMNWRVAGVFGKDTMSDISLAVKPREEGPLQITLTQPCKRIHRRSKYTYCYAGFYVLKPVGLDGWEVEEISEFCNAREIHLTIEMKKNSRARPYLIVPVSYESGQAQNFILSLSSLYLEPLDVSITGSNPKLVRTCALLLSRARGVEKIVKPGFSLHTWTKDQVTITCASNQTSAIDWNSRINFYAVEKQGWCTPDFREEYECKVKPETFCYIGTFFNPEKIPFVMDYVDHHDDNPHYHPPTLSCPLEDPMTFDLQGLRKVVKPIQYDGEVYNPKESVVSKASIKAQAESYLPTLNNSAASMQFRSTTPPLPKIGALTMMGLITTSKESWPMARGVDATDVSGYPHSEDQLIEYFQRFDIDGAGYLSREEFKKMFSAYDGIGLDLPPWQVDDLFSKYDRGDGKLEFEEFAQLMLNRVKW